LWTEFRIHIIKLHLSAVDATGEVMVSSFKTLTIAEFVGVATARPQERVRLNLRILAIAMSTFKVKRIVFDYSLNYLSSTDSKSESQLLQVL
jgi:hypothetical protein